MTPQGIFGTRRSGKETLGDLVTAASAMAPNRTPRPWVR